MSTPEIFTSTTIFQSATNSGQKLNGLCKYEDHIEQVFYNLLLYPFIFMVKNKWEECNKPHKQLKKKSSLQVGTVKNWLSDRIDILASSDIL